MLAEEIIKNGGEAVYMKSFDDMIKFLTKNAKKGDVVITMGAGDIFQSRRKFA